MVADLLLNTKPSCNSPFKPNRPQSSGWHCAPLHDQGAKRLTAQGAKILSKWYLHNTRSRGMIRSSRRHLRARTTRTLDPWMSTFTNRTNICKMDRKSSSNQERIVPKTVSRILIWTLTIPCQLTNDQRPTTCLPVHSPVTFRYTDGNLPHPTKPQDLHLSCGEINRPPTTRQIAGLCYGTALAWLWDDCWSNSSKIPVHARN